jgi:DNA-binding transcriptional LysR family regulator
LFRRIPQGTRLTSAGESLLGPARQTLRDFAAAQAAVTRIRTLESGRLDIASLPGLGDSVLPPLLGRFHTRYPNISLRITDPRSADILGLVRSGEVDVALALVAHPTDELAVVELPSMPIFVALPPGSGHEPGSVVTPSVLDELGLMVGATAKPLVLAILAEIGVTPRITVESDLRETLIPLVLHGFGACLVTGSVAQDAADRGAVICRLDPDLPHNKQVIVYRRSEASPATRAFVGIVADHQEQRGEALPA